MLLVSSVEAAKVTDAARANQGPRLRARLSQRPKVSQSWSVCDRCLFGIRRLSVIAVVWRSRYSQASPTEKSRRCRLPWKLGSEASTLVFLFLLELKRQMIWHWKADYRSSLSASRSSHMCNPRMLWGREHSSLGCGCQRGYESKVCYSQWRGNV